VSWLEGPGRETHRAMPGVSFITDLGDAVQHSEMLQLTPSWIRLIDNRRGFAFKQEWTLT
jgi:hypothetical protein